MKKKLIIDTDLFDESNSEEEQGSIGEQSLDKTMVFKGPKSKKKPSFNL